MKYATNDGLVIEASTPREVVAKLHASSYTQEADDYKFMLHFAGRIFVSQGIALATDTYDIFVADLVKYALIKEVA